MFWDYPRKAFGGLYYCAKFGWSLRSSFDIMQVFRLRKYGLITPVDSPKMEFFFGGGVDPINDEYDK